MLEATNAGNVAASDGYPKPKMYPLQLNYYTVGHGSAFTVNEWLDNILPFAWNQIEAMDPQGVSGDQREQEVINIVRECARVFYLSRYFMMCLFPP